MGSFIIDIYNLDIGTTAAQSWTSTTGLFATIYNVVKEAWCTKVEIKKLKAAGVKDAYLQYWKNLAKKRLYFLLKPKAYNSCLSALYSIASKQNIKSNPSSNISFNTRDKF